MRPVLASLTLASALLFAGCAQAEQKMFFVMSNADGYGVDRCLESGAKCGAAVAAAYCKSRQFVQAASYRKIDRGEITGSVPAGDDSCHGGQCSEFVAIICAR